MYESTGGGGAGPIIDYAAMTAAAAGLESAGARLDSSGGSAPGVGDVGAAAPLAAAILGAFADTGARVSAEAVTIAGIVEACSTGMQAVDAQQAVELLRNGAG
jgi:hypothetical protein